jgi:hypothetical protein
MFPVQTQVGDVLAWFGLAASTAVVLIVTISV